MKLLVFQILSRHIGFASKLVFSTCVCVCVCLTRLRAGQLRFWRSSHTYVQEVRNAVSEKFMRIQEAALHGLGHATVTILELALDETEEPARMEIRAETVSIMTMHVKVFRREGQSCHRFDIIVPMSALASTAAETLMAAISRRLPISLETVRQHSDHLALVLNTDSAPACLRLGRHLSSILPTLQSPCRMHQGCLAMIAVFSLAGIMSALFCGTLLLRRKRVQTLMRRALRSHITQCMHIIYEPPPAAGCAHVASVLELLETLLTQRLSEASRSAAESQTKRIAAWRRLKKFLCGPLDSDGIRHYCPAGCHASKQDAINELEQLLLEVFLDHPPPVPAWNKWSKIVPPLSWFAVFMSLNMLLPGIVTALTAMHGGQDLELDAEDLFGLDNQQTFIRQEQARFTRVQRFLTCRWTRPKLLACTLVLQQTLEILSSCFKASKRNAASSRSILTLIHEERSPVTRVNRNLCHALCDPESSFWLPLRGLQPWTEELLIMASVPAWIELGQLFQRLVRPFRAWPWRLGLLVGRAADDDQKLSLAEELLSCCDHVDPFTADYRKHLRMPADVLSNTNMAFTKDLFDHVPMSNMISED